MLHDPTPPSVYAAKQLYAGGGAHSGVDTVGMGPATGARNRTSSQRTLKEIYYLECFHICRAFPS